MVFKNALPRRIQIKQNLPVMSIANQALHPSNCHQPNTLRHPFPAMQRCRRIDNQSSAIQFYSLLIMGDFYHQLSSCVTGCRTQEHCHRKIRPHHIIFTTHQGIINMCSILHPRFIFTKNTRAYNLWFRRYLKKLCTPESLYYNLIEFVNQRRIGF